MAAYNLVCRCISNQFHKTICLSHRHSLAITSEIELADGYFFTSFSTFLLGKSNPGNFRRCKNTTRCSVIIHYSLVSTSVFRGNNTLVRSSMRQHPLAGNITYRVNARHRSFHPFINGNAMTSVNDTRLVQFYFIENRRTSSCHQNLFSRKHGFFTLALDSHFQAFKPTFDAFNRTACHRLNKLFP